MVTACLYKIFVNLSVMISGGVPQMIRIGLPVTDAPRPACYDPGGEAFHPSDRYQPDRKSVV